MAKMSGADFHGADLTGANLSPLEARPGQGTITTLAKNVLEVVRFLARQDAGCEPRPRGADFLALCRRRPA